ncbi:isoaspartyl peptidase/L-asparaginase family protein [Caldisericum exile]|uniref:Isoaspartyl peptidase n=1 Tax=Caldisericum exile (strain DSM 21853 / NBRC 104410 / AZM16c01) TaxID=511051 RepID=A0A7U6JFR5_CALEA|nr:isoaspartyl peptidase/L-asparaginase [Caldisericum exile]BAL80719.1 isoaspartyl peptidase/L-asparaginase [Caldisericum exile AZM16c01]
MKAIIVHGGAGDAKITHEIPERVQFVKKVAEEGFTLLKEGLDAVEVAVRAVKMLEDHPLFDAGRGSYLNEEGFVEMDAGIMDGSKLSIGAVAGVRNVKNPIELAYLVMEKSSHNILIGNGAEKFGKEHGVEFVPPYYFYSERIIKIFEGTYGDTVGAVVLDGKKIVSAVSTGGTPKKHVGRVGDSPIVGSGFYANDEFGAVSTGIGEDIMKLVLSFRISLYYPKYTINEAVKNCIDDLSRINGRAGLIALDKNGNIGYAFNTKGMFFAYIKEGQDSVIGGF